MVPLVKQKQFSLAVVDIASPFGYPIVNLERHIKNIKACMAETARLCCKHSKYYRVP